MTSITHSISINCPVQQVFDFVSNFENDKYWWEAVIETQKLTPGPIGVGTEFDELTKVLFVRVQNHLRVTKHQPPTLICYRNESPQLSYDLEYHFAPEQNGTTFTLVATLEFKGALRLLFPIAMSTLHGQLDRSFDILKRHLESHAQA